MYTFDKALGCGSFGFVVAAFEKKSGDHLALKVYIIIVYYNFRL